MKTIEQLDKQYIVRNKDPFLNSPPREIIRYISSDHYYLSMLFINPNGIEPREYIQYVKADLISRDTRGAINAIGNAKRAVHLLIDSLLEISGLALNFLNKKFPKKLDIIERAEFFPTILINNLNQERNIIEHEYQKINFEDAKKFVALAEMLQLLCYPILKQFVHGIHIGIDNDERDLFLLLNNSSGKIKLMECSNAKYCETTIGRIYYHFPPETKSKIIKEYELRANNIDEWITYFNTLVYATMFNLVPKNPPYDPESEERIISFQTREMPLDDRCEF
jgi:hypothetical protein